MDKILKLSVLMVFSLMTTKNTFAELKENQKDSSFYSRHFKPAKFQSLLEFSGTYSTRRYSSLGVRNINGVSFNNNKFVGLGIGLTRIKDHYFNEFSSYVYIPVFLRFSIKPLPNKGLMLFTDVGTHIRTPQFFDVISDYPRMEPNILKPMFLRIGVGNEFKIKNKSVHLALSYRYNKARYYTSGYYWRDYDYRVSDWYRSHTLELTLGIKLK